MIHDAFLEGFLIGWLHTVWGKYRVCSLALLIPADRKWLYPQSRTPNTLVMLIAVSLQSRQDGCLVHAHNSVGRNMRQKAWLRFWEESVRYRVGVLIKRATARVLCQSASKDWYRLVCWQESRIVSLKLHVELPVACQSVSFDLGREGLASTVHTSFQVLCGVAE